MSLVVTALDAHNKSPMMEEIATLCEKYNLQTSNEWCEPVGDEDYLAL